MSHVSGVTVLCCCSEDDQLPAFASWLDAHAIKARLNEVTDAGGGNKHPQQAIYQAGFNYFPEDEFAAFVGALPWRRPGNVVLVIQPEHNTTRVWRFTDGVWAELSGGGQYQ